MVATAQLATETLADVGTRLRKALVRASGAEIRVAIEIMKMADEWEVKWQPQDPERRTVKQWVSKELRPHDYSYYERIARNAEFVGVKLAARMDREALQRLCCHAKTVQDVEIVKLQIHEKYRANGSVPLTVGQMSVIVAPISASRQRGEMWQEKWRRERDENVKLKARIDRLEAQIRGLGKEPVE
jgi:hypothetical protein